MAITALPLPDFSAGLPIITSPDAIDSSRERKRWRVDL